MTALRITPISLDGSLGTSIDFEIDEVHDTPMRGNHKIQSQDSKIQAPRIVDNTSFLYPATGSGTSTNDKKIIDVTIRHRWGTTLTKLDTLFAYTEKAFRVFPHFLEDESDSRDCLLDPNTTELRVWGELEQTFTTLTFYETLRRT